jgi:hypothetical protein
MRNTKLIRNTLMAGAFMALVACSSTGSGGADTGTPSAGGVAVQVTNDVVPPTTVTVWIVPETGGRRRLGTISPNGQQTFNFNPGITSMEYRLVAEASGSEDRSSNPFVLEGVPGVQWSVSSVVVRTSR